MRRAPSADLACRRLRRRRAWPARHRCPRPPGAVAPRLMARRLSSRPGRWLQGPLSRGHVQVGSGPEPGRPVRRILLSGPSRPSSSERRRDGPAGGDGAAQGVVLWPLPGRPSPRSPAGRRGRGGGRSRRPRPSRCRRDADSIAVAEAGGIHRGGPRSAAFHRDRGRRDSPWRSGTARRHRGVRGCRDATWRSGAARRHRGGPGAGSTVTVRGGCVLRVHRGGRSAWCIATCEAAGRTIATRSP